MDPSETRLRLNSSFSPPLSRRWQCRFPLDESAHETPSARFYGSSLSSRSKGSRSGVSSDQYANYHHSVSEGELPYFDSPSNSLQAPRSSSPVQSYDLGELSMPTPGASLESSMYPRRNQRHYTLANIPQFSPSPLSQSSRWASSNKHPAVLTPRNFPGRRSFMSTPVYPLIFHSPASDIESIAGPSTSNRLIPENTFNSDIKSHKPLSHYQKVNFSPDSGANIRREGFRWSNNSSFDFGADGEVVDFMEHIGFENLASPSCPVGQRRCELCYRLLQQKSPWSSQRIIRNRDLPIAGVLPCGHVFHADCLEETTPKSQIQDPPCPLCLNLFNHDGSSSFSEPLSSNPNDVNLRRNKTQLLRGSSSTRSRLRRRLSFKGKMGRDLFGSKLFKKVG
ncbi:hypothetical protein AXF42_Ash008660 [Apostasia shenzhenica]|uniref:RING-type domain-containing protein n=1 Tax=Apostasia shenzhenica TaxID=1088818 RepID=A0A2I0B212_9ASPA|nr:hypothetical protein AXF42_Ash008660 [Apostasia shenzhenica]